MNDSHGQPTLKGGLPMGDLYTREGLARLDDLFLKYLEGAEGGDEPQNVGWIV